jgi:hypothetical protein
VNYGQWENYPEEKDPFINPESQPDALFIQQPDGSFIEQAELWGLKENGISRSSVFADLNEDGWLDLLRSQIFGPTQLFLSTCGSAGWLEVELQNTGSNTMGVGATIQIVADGHTQTDWIRAGGTNIAAGGPQRVHFGLGEACEANSLIVTWPDGNHSSFQNIPANQRVTIVRED